MTQMCSACKRCGRLRMCTPFCILIAVVSAQSKQGRLVLRHVCLLTQVEEPVFRTQLLPALPGYQGLFYGRCPQCQPLLLLLFRLRC